MIVYQITNTVNEKRYIGLTQRKPGKRWSAHKWDAAKGVAMPISRAIAHHGADKFVFEPIASLMPGLSRADLCDLERFLIAQEGTLAPNGYNLTPGGDGAPVGMPSPRRGKVSSPEHRAKLRAAWARNPARKLAHIESQRGKVMSEEARAKMSEAARSPNRLDSLRDRNAVMNKDPAHWEKISKGWAKSPHKIENRSA